MRDQILSRFMARYPTLKGHQAETYVDRYIIVTLRFIKEGIAKGNRVNDEFPLSLTELRKAIGKVYLDKKQQWVTSLMRHDNQLSLITVNFEGNEGKLSRVSLNPIYEQQIMEEIINLNYELSPKRLKEIKDNANVKTPVNLESLQSYLAKTTLTLEQVKNDPSYSPAYKDTLKDNIVTTDQLIAHIVTDVDGSLYLPEYWQETDSGRMYGKGLSLQRVRREIRKAALGTCHQYDFKACSFALMTGLALYIVPDLKVADLVDYVKNRASIRKRLSVAMGIDPYKGKDKDLVKDIFTSLGFGASTADNPYTSIRQQLSDVQYEILMADKQFKHIRQQLKLVRDVISEFFKADTFEFFGRQYNCIDPNNNPARPKKRNRNQKLAWIYQVMESNAITRFGQIANEAGCELLLAAHDCLYFRNELSENLLAEIMCDLNQHFQLLSVEHEKVKPISIAGDIANEIHRDHKARMRQEAYKAGLSYADAKPHQLDPMYGYFANEISQLNERVPMNMGRSVDLSRLNQLRQG